MGIEVVEKGTKKHRVFRHDNFDRSRILPGDSRQILKLTYHVTDDLFSKYSHGSEYDELVEVRVFVNGTVASVSKPFREIQKF
jgi:hypothetical protein